MKSYKDPFLQSLLTAYTANPGDIAFKKYFGLELYKRGELQDAFVLLQEVFAIDQDIQVEKALNTIRGQITQIGDIKEALISSPKEQPITFTDVAGMEEIKDAIRTDIIYPFQHPEIYKQYSKKSGGGILLFGPPGCGKTYIAKATAGEIQAKFYSISIHEVLSKFSGEGERFLHDFFEVAREHKPSVLFFDEIDAIGIQRDKTSGIWRTLVNQFLLELDGIGNNNDGLLIIGATNLPWDVDMALRRPGRFDKVLFVGPPDTSARIRMFELNLNGKPTEKMDIPALARMTKQFSGADIARICDAAAETAFKEAVKSDKVVPITQEMLELIS